MASREHYAESNGTTGAGAAKAAGPTLIDRVIGYVSPMAGLRRATARELLQRAYEGASPQDGWRPRRAGASANADVMADGAPLRYRARALVQNVPYIARAVRQLVAQTVGTGITLRSLAENASQVDKLYTQFVNTADADGLGNLYSLLARALRAQITDGEVLIRIRPRRPDDGLPVPVQFQLLEIDWLDTSKNGTHNGNVIINGIEYNGLGRKIAYWLYDRHPGEVVGLTGRSGVTSSPVDAVRIIHYYNPERPGQGRGISRLAPIIASARDLQLYQDSERQRKNLETRLAVIASGDLAQMQNPPTINESGSTVGTDLGQLPSGGIIEAPPGVNLTTVAPQAAPGYVDYVKDERRIIAACIGVTYEMATGDVSEVNFSSARIGQQDVRREIEQEQWLNLIPNLCQPMADAFFEFAVMGGKLPATQDRAIDWSTPRWEYVNPRDDVKADMDEVGAGLSSLSEKLRRRGLVPDLVYKELSDDLKRLEQDGTLARMAVLRGQGSTSNLPGAADSASQRAEEDTLIQAMADLMAGGNLGAP